MTVEFLDEAYAEFLQAILHFDQLETGLGDRFEHAVWKAIDAIRDNPLAWQPITKHTRRRIIRRFNYGIVYAVRNSGILIVAIMHMHQRPGFWHERLR